MRSCGEDSAPAPRLHSAEMLQGAVEHARRPVKIRTGLNRYQMIEVFAHTAFWLKRSSEVTQRPKLSALSGHPGHPRPLTGCQRLAVAGMMFAAERSLFRTC